MTPSGALPEAVFLDRDGVVNRKLDGDYVRTWDQFEFLPGALDGLARIAGWARHVVVVTNQQGVGKGLMGQSDLADIHRRMREEVEAAGARIDEILTCPHLAEEGCQCRKPLPGLVRDWLAQHPAIRPEQCVVVGDSDSDMAMGRAVGLGVYCVLVGPAAEAPTPTEPDLRCASLLEFARRSAQLFDMPVDRSRR